MVKEPHLGDGYSDIKPPQFVVKGRESPLALVGDL